MPTRLSVNVNKVAWLRNSRHGNLPSVLRAAADIVNYGAGGITIHPRPDERHITSQDVVDLATWWQDKKNTIEFNIEGFPDDRYLSIIKKWRPTQATLVPDEPSQKTSDHGYQLINQMARMKKIIADIKSWGVRTSIFIDPNVAEVERVKEVGGDAIELYTGPYAEAMQTTPNDAEQKKILAPYVMAANRAVALGLFINAGHDLNLHNLPPLVKNLPKLDEVSIGHALIADALWYGLEKTIALYQKALGQ